MPNLMIIDIIPVSDEERTKAELYFMEQQVTFLPSPRPRIILDFVHKLITSWPTVKKNPISLF